MINSDEKIIKQIEALKYLIETDTNEKDKKIHSYALKKLEDELKHNWRDKYDK